MNGITTIITLVFGILSVILFFKVWGMCNNVKEMKELLERECQPKRYHYLHNTSYEALREEEALIQELAHCKKFDEAKLNLDRLLFHFEKAKERQGKFGLSSGSGMGVEKEILDQILESAKQWMDVEA